MIGNRSAYIELINITADGKIGAIMPYIDFENRNKDIDIEGYYRNFKGFYEVLSKRWKFEAAK
jgi:hypothetical protein